ncbi:MAG: F0F1 ATP synthase subunit B [Flavobacteriaceae bacterium]|nr:F0F1 ATP synthase subunit B [Flavobacteriaceae bacterium]
MEKLINDFSFGLFIWQIILFVLLLLLLRKYAWNPILNALNDREEGIQNALDEADKARQEMLDLKSSNEAILKEARAERDSLLKDAREIKDKMISEAKDEAKEQANKIVEQAKVSIENEKLAAITHLKNQVAELSIGIAEKVIKEELSNKGKQVALIEKMLDEATLK